MRAALVITLIVIILALVGWISFANTGDSATVSINKTKIKEDTKQIVERGEEFVDNASKKGKEVIDDFQNSNKKETVESEVK